MFERLAEKAKIALCDKYSLEDFAVEWRRPQEQSHGDAATSIALQLAKKLQKKPQEIAQVLKEAMEGDPTVEKAEVAGAGYVNVWLKPVSLFRELKEARDLCSPKPSRIEERPVIIDFFGPNIAKPLGIHHILTTVIGQSLINLYRHLGYPVIGWSYPGDWGTQFGKLWIAYQQWGEKKPVRKRTVEELLSLYVRFHDEAERNPALEEEARGAFAKLEEGDQMLRTFREDVVLVTKQSLNSLCDRLHVHIDVETGESFYEDKMKPIIEEGTKKGVFKNGEGGALIVEFSTELKLPPLLLRKSDGSTLYATRDLAMVRYRLDSYAPQAAYYVVGSAQSLHFQQLFATCRLLGWDLPEMEHVAFGHMRFADAAMSTRKGTALRLEDVLDEAVRRANEVIAEHRDSIQTDDESSLAEMMGVGSVVYGILSQSRKVDIIFDWKKVLALDGNSAPYLQYTYARARSVLRKSEEKKFMFPKDAPSLSAHERALIGVLLQFSDVLEDARANRMPHTLANYLYELCQTFNAFYNVDPILKTEGSVRALRLALTDLASSVLKTGAEILTLRVPERM